MNDQWQEGYDAFFAGAEWTDNPYHEFDDKRFGEWMKGFDDGEEHYQANPLSAIGTAILKGKTP
jgi:hypothetical protein